MSLELVYERIIETFMCSVAKCSWIHYLYTLEYYGFWATIYE